MSLHDLILNELKGYFVNLHINPCTMQYYNDVIQYYLLSIIYTFCMSPPDLNAYEVFNKL